MKFKFLRAALASVMLFVSIGANASLIKNGLEWLDLNVSVGKTVNQVYSTVLNQRQYSAYRYATQSEADAFWSSYFLSSWSTATSEVWHKPEGLVDASYQNFLNQSYGYEYFFTYTLTTEEGEILFNKIWDGIFIFDNGVDDASSASYFTYAAGVTGWDAILKYSPQAYSSIGVRLKSQEVSNNLNQSRYVNHLLVKNVKVPEPSTLAIFALGMIGLASRRFKKQQ